MGHIDADADRFAQLAIDNSKAPPRCSTSRKRRTRQRPTGSQRLSDAPCP